MDLKLIKRSLRDLKFCFAKRRLRENIVFVHIPKCAGTSIISEISKLYPSHAVTKLNAFSATETAKLLGFSEFEFRTNLLCYELFKNHLNTPDGRLVTGHWTINSRDFYRFGHKWNFITMLRNPEERLISHFFFNKGKRSLHYMIPENQSFSDFLSTNRANDFKGVYVKHLTQKNVINDDTIKEACNLLENFDLIGVVEKLEKFQKAFQKRFCKKLNFKKINRNPIAKKYQERELTTFSKNQIRKICEPDWIIYNHALKVLRNSY